MKAREVKVSAGSSGKDLSIGKGEGHGWELCRAHEMANVFHPYPYPPPPAAAPPPSDKKDYRQKDKKYAPHTNHPPLFL
jgi:hypothetical protein